MNKIKNLKVVVANYILICDDDFSIIENGAIIFDKKIYDIGNIDTLRIKYPDLMIPNPKENSIIMPGLINTHTHLEFSKNRTSLKYGNFTNWLNSVIENRDNLINGIDKNFVDKILLDMLSTGTTAIGAISSYGTDMESCIESDMKVIYFNEAIGSKPETVDILFNDFKSRYNNSKNFKSDNFIPAIAIHSPYSVHPILTKRILKIAKDDKTPLSTHFMESKAEKDWCENSDGELKNFFNNFLNQKKSLINPIDFLNQFQDIKTAFTHSVEIDSKMLKIIKNNNSSIIHSPISNRLLNNKALDINLIEKYDIDISIGTDGLSSNNSLNMFDELRTAMFIHRDIEINSLSKKLILYATKNGAKALNLNSGILEIGKDSDFISFQLPDKLNYIDDIATQILLHTKKVKNIFINGNEIEI